MQHVPLSAEIRSSERVIIVFLIYAAAAAVILPVASNVKHLVLLTNLAVILIYALLANSKWTNWMWLLGYVRDWLLLGLILLAYREMGWLALPHSAHGLETRWIVWDRAILRGLAASVEAFGSALPSVLEIAYALVYALAPFSVAVLYLYRRRDRLDRFLCIFTLGVLLCYAQFPLWPSEPPRILFATENLPAYDTLFRRFNWWTLGNYGIHTSCFPSGHVAAAFSAAFGMRSALPERKWVSRFLMIMALLIAVATVYGRYHYAADAAAGLAVAFFAWAVVAAPQRARQWMLARKEAASSSAGADFRAANPPNFRPIMEANHVFSTGSIHSAIGVAPALSIGTMQPVDQADNGKRGARC
jgi:membrane-associated phospholipid phosphatase